MVGKNRNEASSIECEILDILRNIIRGVNIYSVRLKEKYGLNASQLSCLLVLGEQGPLSLSAISQSVLLSPSMITGIIDQLEDKELVTRNRNSSDRRKITIALTPEGKKILKKAPQSFQKKLMESLGTLGGKQKNNIRRALGELLSLIVKDVVIDASLPGTEESSAGLKSATQKLKFRK